jgi:hypothetical protein
VVAAELRDKDLIVAGVRRLFRKHQVIRYAFLTEGWMVDVKGGELPATPPSKHPDRREILLVQAGDRHRRSLIVSYYILRPEHGAPTLTRARNKRTRSPAGLPIC